MVHLRYLLNQKGAESFVVVTFDSDGYTRRSRFKKWRRRCYELGSSVDAAAGTSLWVPASAVACPSLGFEVTITVVGGAPLEAGP
ncbi:MAG: hypothetical protein ACYTGZ_15600 [Planctomycetota bacterium]